MLCPLLPQGLCMCYFDCLKNFYPQPCSWVLPQGFYFGYSFSASSRFFFFFFFCLFAISWTTPMAYGGSQTRGRIGDVAASLHQGHSNVGSEPRLQPTPQSQQCQILNPLNKARDRTHNLMVPSWIC